MNQCSFEPISKTSTSCSPKLRGRTWLPLFGRHRLVQYSHGGSLGHAHVEPTGDEGLVARNVVLIQKRAVQNQVSLEAEETRTKRTCEEERRGR